MGFELAVAFQTTITISEAGELLRRLVDNHDKPEIHTLIIVAGAPTRSGLAFPSDSVLGRLALDHVAVAPLETNHLARVLIHFWDTRAVAEIKPGDAGFELVCGELPLGD